METAYIDSVSRNLAEREMESVKVAIFVFAFGMRVAVGMFADPVESTNRKEEVVTQVKRK